MNKFGGGASGVSMNVGDILSTPRTVTDSSYMLCDGRKIINPSTGIQQAALLNGELTSKMASMGMSAQAATRAIFYDGKYMILVGNYSNTSYQSSGYPFADCWTKNSNGTFTYNGRKVLISLATCGGPSSGINVNGSSGAVCIKCGNYYYIALVTSDNTLYVCYTTNPASSWSYRQVDISTNGISRPYYPSLYTDGSNVRLDVFDRTSGAYKIHTFQFNGDVSNISYIGVTYTSSNTTNPLTEGILRVGSYYVSGDYLGSSDKFYKTFTGNWTKRENSSNYWTNQTPFFSALGYIWWIRRRGDTNNEFEWWLQRATSLQNAISATSLETIYLVPNSEYSSTGWPRYILNADGSYGSFTTYNNILYLPTTPRSSNDSTIIRWYAVTLSASYSSGFSYFDTPYVTSGTTYTITSMILDPGNVSEFIGANAMYSNTGEMGFIGAATPAISLPNRNSYMKLA